MTKERDCYIYEPNNLADASIIWLHGLGADGSDFVGIMDQLGLPAKHGVRFIFPNAPLMPVSVNNGFVMPAWYDIYAVDILSREDAEGIKRSERTLMDLVQYEIKQGIDSNRILIGGFSQGGAVSLYSGLRSNVELGGLIILSSYLPMAQTFDAARFPVNHSTPIFIAHGLFDPIVPYSAGQAACEQLRNADYKVDWHSYPMLHTLIPQEITDIGNFINRCLGYA